MSATVKGDSATVKGDAGVSKSSAASRRTLQLPMVHRHLGDKRFAYTTPRALTLQILHAGDASSLVQHVYGGIWAHKNRAISQMVYIAYTNRDLRSVMRTAHAHVKGIDSVGERYHALNPELFFFQHATYVDTLIASIEIFGRRLSWQDKCTLYDECKLWYAKYDISDRAQPNTYGDFVDWFDEYCSRHLAVSPDALLIRDEVLNPATWYPHNVPTGAIRAMLDPRVAQLLDAQPSAADRASLKLFVARTNARLKVLPAEYRLIPSARHDPDR